MPDPSPQRPEETEEARLEREAKAWLVREGLYGQRWEAGREEPTLLSPDLPGKLVALLRSERRDAMEKAANIAQQHGALYLSSNRKAACFTVAAAIRREMGE